jgi:AcrR family transcriptional regulator
MPSTRHTDDAVLKAARELVLAVGVRRTTLTDVARRAGLSRMTLYRRYPDINALVRELLTRELVDLLDAARRRHQALPTARQRLVGIVSSVTRAVNSNELFRRILDIDPELLAPYVFDRLGVTQQAAVALFADEVSQGHLDGSVRAGEVSTQAHAILLAAQPFVISLRSASSIVPPEALQEEVGVLLDAYLRPSPTG